MTHFRSERSLHSVVANALDWVIVISEFELQSFYYVHFRTNALRKDGNNLIPKLSVQSFYYCPIKKGLALNNPQR